MNDRRHRQRAPAPTLKIGSHNVRGLRKKDKLKLLLKAWNNAGYHILLLQETHLIDDALTADLDGQLQLAGWTSLWAHHTSSSAGVGILIRSTLIEADIQLTNPQPSSDGRLLSVNIKWSGHSFQLMCAYFPNTVAQQILFLNNQVSPTASLDTPTILGGDFNFVHDAGKDRLNRQGTTPDPAARAWERSLPTLRDTFRHLHPSRRKFTWVGTGSASRIDRFYACPALLPSVVSSTVHTATPSDHNLAVVTLLGRHPPTRAPPRRRIRTTLLQDREAKMKLGDWTRLHLAAAPTDALELLAWWPGFKASLGCVCQTLAAEVRGRHNPNRTAEARAAMDAAHSRLLTGQLNAIADITATRKQYVTALRQDLAQDDLHIQRHWLHTREHPSKQLSLSLGTPAGAHAIPALRNAAGRLVTGGAAAQRSAQFWADISAARPVDEAAQAEVLDALASTPRLPTTQAAALGSTSVTREEVVVALKRGAAGKSPGLDGIPIEIYRAFAADFSPVLAALYSAIGTTGQSPAGFTDGLIVQIYKKGDRAAVGNYRPITLLNTDYRSLAKVLACRLVPCLGEVISPEQTAFLHGRHMGEGIMLVQCVAQLLHRQGRGALAVFCDFEKAYDTVDRGFLFKAMATLGLGNSFIQWAQLLLTDTRARASVNNYMSPAVHFAAGVRQGCPLAPLLYLCVAQALLCFLRHRRIGVEFQDRLVTASQYADDAIPMLASPEHVPGFLEAMDTFGAATGQRLNRQKTQLLPIGHHNIPLPPTIAGLQVVSQAEALGLKFQAITGLVQVEWEGRLAQVHSKFAKISRLTKSLSIFGRGFATAAYGVSPLLYNAEFGGMPPPASLEALSKATSRVINYGNGKKFYGIKTGLLSSHPKEGGFGALPWFEHITARHAVWALRLLCGASTKPWVHVARRLIAAYGETVEQYLWAHDPNPQVMPRTPEPLRRCLLALQRVPSPKLVPDTQPPEPAAWCVAAPLWGNIPEYRVAGVPLDNLGVLELNRGAVRTVGDLLRLRAAIPILPPHLYQGALASHFHDVPAMADRSQALAAVQRVLRHIPPAWVTAAVESHTRHDQMPQPGQSEYQLAPPEAAARVLLDRYSHLGTHWGDIQVKDITSMLMSIAPASECRVRKLDAYYRLSTNAPLFPLPPPGQGSPPPGTIQELHHLQQRYQKIQNAQAVQGVLAALWALPAANKQKETFWRLVLDGLPTPERRHTANARCTVCQAEIPGRLHQYWECPAVTPLIAALQQAVGEPIARRNFWLAIPPAGVIDWVWQATCLAAASALRRMWTMLGANRQEPPSAARAAAAAQSYFWHYMVDFVVEAEPYIPAAWKQQLNEGHPIISVQPNGDLIVQNNVSV
jgi:exonuclease III